MQKLLNKNKDFIETLEELYLMTISMKGSKNVDSMKSLINYLIGLTIHRPAKCNQVLEYLKEEK